MPASSHPYQRRTSPPIWRQWLLLGLVLGGLVLWLSQPGQIPRANAWLQDWATRWHSRSAAPEVVLVLVDDRSIATIGRWPWRRALHAQMVQHISAGQPQSIALDFLFTEEDLDYPADDLLLAHAMQDSGRVVLPISTANGTNSVYLPIAPLAEAAAALAHSRIPHDPDGNVRRFAPWLHTPSASWPHMALALPCVERPQLPLCQPPDSSSTDTSWLHTQHPHIGFARRQPSFTHYSYIDVLQGRIPASAFRNKHVLIGASATGLAQTHATPSAPGQPSMSDVELMGHILHGILQGSHLHSAPTWVNQTFNLAVVLAGLLALLWLGPSAALLACLGLGLLTLAANLVAPMLGWVLQPAAALLGLISAYPLWSWRRQTAALRFLQQEMKALQAQGMTLEALGDGAKGAKDFVQQRITVVELALQQLHQLQAQREQAMRFISHDIRAPIGAILTSVEMERNFGPTPDAPPLLERVERHAHSALRLADDFVHLARSLEQPSQQRAPVELGLLIDQALDDVWAMATAHRIRLHWQAQEQEAFTLGDASQLRRALVNLLTNAIKYSPQETDVDVQLQLHDGHWHISVRDQGHGIDEQELPHLFTPFARQKRHEGGPVAGIGLGLAYVATVARQHGGQIQARNHPEGGAEFVLQLPSSTPPDQA